MLGCQINLASVLGFSDAMIFMMSIPNVIGLYLLAPVVKGELNRYYQALQSGEIKSNRQG